MGMVAILFNGAEPFEQIVNTFLTEGPIRNLVKTAPAVSEKKIFILFVLRFYDPVNPIGSCRARSVYLTTRLLDRLSPLSG